MKITSVQNWPKVLSAVVSIAFACCASGAPVVGVNFAGSYAFSNVGSLGSARVEHAATLLTDGSVLVTGGAGTGASAELFNPNSRTWSSTGSLASPRALHTSTLLPNGKVLVVGGIFGDISLKSAELYNPETKTWSSAGNLVHSRFAHEAVVLPNGKVLVIGGREFNANTNPWIDNSLDSSELYDPATNSWSAAAGMIQGRYDFTSTLLTDGKVLVTGGYNGNVGFISSAEIYNPVANSWSGAASLSAARYNHTATMLINGKVLVAGGYGDGVLIAAAQLYDPATNVWSAAGAFNTARDRHTAALLPNGDVIVMGGNTENGELASAQIYNPTTNAWTSAVSLNKARRDHTVTTLADGTVLVVGGFDQSGLMDSVELYGLTEAVVTVAEGQLGSQTGTFSDPNGNAGVTLTASRGSVTQNNAAGTWSWSGTGDNGPSVSGVVITATDAASVTATARFTLAVTNAAPEVVITGDVSPNAGEAVSFTFTATDPSNTDQAAGFAWSVDYGDGSANVTVPAGTASPLTLSHTFARGNACIISATATDKDGGVSPTATLSITPNVVFPSITDPTVAFLIPSATTLGGTVASDGGADITERGVVYSITTENADPILGGTGVTTITSGGTTGLFTVDASGLTIGTGYSFKAYAINIKGVSYTSVRTFIATSNNAPALMVDANTGPMTTSILADFTGSSDPTPGARPQGSLVSDEAGAFLGMTSLGGTNNIGTIFSLSEDGTVTNLVSFTGVSGDHPGANPSGSLVSGGDGYFYGMTSKGGTGNYGTVFRVSREGQHEVLANFTGTSGNCLGSLPTGSLVLGNDGNFYGMTQSGGTKGVGTIFNVSTVGTVSTMVNFTGTTGANPGSRPTGDLLLSGDGNFYGMTQAGGVKNLGTIFFMDPDGLRTTILEFTGTIGANLGSAPLGSLVEGMDGNLYGMTSAGGTGGFGTLFRFNGGLQTLVNFTGVTGTFPGARPSGSLVQAGDGSFYATTSFGGTANLGTVFKYTPGGAFATQVNFAGNTGDNRGATPAGNLVQSPTGALFGMTQSGGQINGGVIFKLEPPVLGVRVAEGGTAVQTGTFSDLDGNDTVTLTASSGTLTRNNAAGTWSWSSTAASDGPVSSVITITATDAVGAVIEAPFVFTVLNIAPTLVLTGPATAKAGAVVNFTLTASDIAPADQAAGFSWNVDYGDGTSGSSIPAGTGSPFVASHIFPNAGTFTVSARAVDKDGGRSVSATQTITLSAPDLSIAGNNVTITNGDDTPALDDSTDFGNALPNSGSVVRTFTIKNLSTGSLAVGAVTVAAAADGTPGSADFVISKQPTSPLAKGASQTFTVTFAPTEEGARAALLQLSYGGGAGQFQFTVAGNGANSAPTNITLSATSVSENNDFDADVATLSGVDPDGNEAFSFSLVDGEGGDDNGTFIVVDNVLKISAVTDFETLAAYHIRLAVTDEAGASFEKAFVISVTDIAEIPVVSMIEDVSIPEDSSAGPLAFSVVDGGAAATVSIVSTNTALVKPANVVVEGSGADFSLTITPLANAYGTATITVRVSNGNLTGSTSFVLDVLPVNDAPSFKLPADLTGQAGMAWTGVDDLNMTWTGIASSADGTKLAATTTGDNIYTSSDSGVTWTPRASVQNWAGIASSADGKKLAAVATMGPIYISTNSGLSWTAQESARKWTCIASSADGTKLAAAADNDVIYTSTNAGLKWTAQAPAGTHHWRAIASSADGSKLAAVDSGGQIYTSSNGGGKWTAQSSAGIRGWSGIASSADGIRLAAVAKHVDGEYIYTSKDSGITWKARPLMGEWTGITISADGMRLAAVSASGISISPDGGISWQDADGGGSDWTGIASSADGRQLVACERNGIIHLSRGGTMPFYMGVVADSGPSSTEKVVTQLVAGPANESNQVVTLSVETDDETLFTVPPAISASGALTFTPGSNEGVATVTLTAMDDGGADNDGVDTSEPQTIVIYISAPLVPDIALEQDYTMLSSGDSMDLGTLGTNFSKLTTFTIRNNGTGYLSGIKATLAGANATMFSISKAPETGLMPLDYTTFILQSKLTSVGEKSATLKIASNDPDTAFIEINLTATGQAPVLPDATTSKVDMDGVDAASAGIGGTVNAKGITRQVYIDFGLTNTYESSVFVGEFSGEDPEDVFYVFEGLAAHTTYHFRVRAVSDLGSASGQDMTFTTNTNFPEMRDLSVSVCIGAVATIDPFADDNSSDADGDKLTITGKAVLDNPTAGTIAVVANKLVFTPKSGFVDPVMITYNVTDGFGGNVEAYVTVNPGSVSAPEQMIYPAAAATHTDLTFDTDAFWAVSEKLSWLSVSPAKGVGSGTLNITLQPNTSVMERFGDINIGGAIVTIHQSGVEEPSISLGSEGPFNTIIGDSGFSLPIVTVNAPVTYTVTGKLPAGITLNQNTGIFSGSPTQVGSFPNITVTAKNAKASAPETLTFTINVAALPAGAIGTFNGLVDASDTAYLTADSGLGARFEMTTTATGGATGKIIEGATSKAFIGKVVATVADANHPAVIASITGTPFSINLTIDATKDALVNTDDVQSVMKDSTGALSTAVHAWRNAWSSKVPIRLATAYKALHTFAIENTSDGGPDGFGYGSFTVTDTTGAFTMAGKLADGSGLTGSSFIGQNGEVLIYQSLYSNRGSCLGQLTVTPGTSAPANNSVAGTLIWMKPVSPAKAKDTVYAEGFGPLTLAVAGSAYSVPAKGKLVMGLLPPTPAATGWNALLDFSLGGLETEGKEFTQLLRIASPSATSLTNIAVFPGYNAAGNPNPNPYKVAMPTLMPATGLFTGTYTIPGASKALDRAPAYFGQIVRIFGVPPAPTTTRGYGYFLLPKVPVGSQTVKTSPAQSGAVVLEEAP